MIERSQDKGNQAKFDYGGIDYNMVMIKVREMVTFGGILTERGHKGAFWNAGYIPHLYLGGQYTSKSELSCMLDSLCILLYISDTSIKRQN